MKVVTERRVASSGELAKKLAWPIRMSRSQAWTAVVIGTVVTGWADAVTGTELWFGPVYLLIIGFAAWSLGWLQAVGFGLAILTTTLSVNGFELYPDAGAALAWNIAMRVFAVLALVGLLHGVRQMYDREWRHSRTDPLTGALNRKALFELTTGRTYSRSWSMLVYADLDGLKELNDKLGHVAGDDCLSRFASHVTKAIRKKDFLARLGGDEFLIYMDVRDEASAKAVATRLHRAMNDVVLANGTRLKCSVGALILSPGQRAIDREVRAADILMYAAKGLGSSLVVGTATAHADELSIVRHWELTPQSSEQKQQLKQSFSQSRRSARTFDPSPVLSQIA